MRSGGSPRRSVTANTPVTVPKGSRSAPGMRRSRCGMRRSPGSPARWLFGTLGPARTRRKPRAACSAGRWAVSSSIGGGHRLPRRGRRVGRLRPAQAARREAATRRSGARSATGRRHSRHGRVLGAGPRLRRDRRVPDPRGVGARCDRDDRPGRSTPPAGAGAARPPPARARGGRLRLLRRVGRTAGPLPLDVRGRASPGPGDPKGRPYSLRSRRGGRSEPTDTALELVRRPGRAGDRAGARLPAPLAVRRAPRPARRARPVRGARAGDVPVLLVRGSEGRLRAFLNVCRHRGSLVCEGEGRRETLQCPYHAWTYDLDGSLRSAPRSEREPGFDHRRPRPVPLSVGDWGPFVFVNPDSATRPRSADVLGPLPELLAAGGIDVENLRFLRRDEGEYAANWKVCCENYLECYHCQVAHPGFSRVVDVRRTRTGSRRRVGSPASTARSESGSRERSTRQERSSEASSTSSSRTRRSTSCRVGPTSRSGRSSLCRRANAPLPRLLRLARRRRGMDRRPARLRRPGRRRGPCARGARPARRALWAARRRPAASRVGAPRRALPAVARRRARVVTCDGRGGVSTLT